MSTTHRKSDRGEHVDHVVPLKEAHESDMSTGDLTRFDTYIGNHRCLPVGVNTSKSSNEPHGWLSTPKAGAYFVERPQPFFEFVAIWVGVKSSWDMTADWKEHAAAKVLLQHDCADAAAPSLSGPVVDNTPGVNEPLARTDTPAVPGTLDREPTTTALATAGSTPSTDTIQRTWRRTAQGRQTIDRTDLWAERDLSSGRFERVKEQGGFFKRGSSFRGVPRER